LIFSPEKKTSRFFFVDQPQKHYLLMGFFDGDSELVHQTIFPIRNMPSIDVQTGVLRCVFSSLVKVSGVRSIALPRSNRAQTRHINCRKPKSMKHR